MAVKVIDSAGAVFAVWGKPTREDVDRVDEALKRVAERAGHPIVYVTRVPTDAPAPDDMVRKYLSMRCPMTSAQPPTRSSSWPIAAAT